MTAASDPTPTVEAQWAEDGRILPVGVQRGESLSLGAPSRSWIPLGTVDAGAIADVDPAGLVQMRGTTWSLDWWVGAEDRWHHPSTDAAVRQRVLGDGPVVETAMRVPGGDIVHKVFGVRGTSGDESGISWDDSGVVVEIENLTSVPVALALVLRPFVLDGDGSITMLRSSGPVLTVDTTVAAVLSKPVVRSVVGVTGTAPTRLAAGDDDEADGEESWPSHGGPLEGAYVVALPHTAVVRVLLPRVDTGKAGRSRRARNSVPAAPGPVWDAPASEAIEAGWDVHTRDTARVQMPENLLDTVVASSVRTLSLAAGDDFFEGDGSASAAVRNAELCDALVRVGLREPLGPLARALLASERLGGSIRMSDGSDATVALVHAAAPLLVGSRSEEWVEDLVGPVAKAIHRLGRGKGLGSTSLVRSAAIALGRVAPSLRVAGQPDVADAADEVAARLWASVGSEDSAAMGESAPVGGSSTFARAIDVRSAIAVGDPSAIADLVALARLGTPGGLGDMVTADGIASGARGLDPAAIAARTAAVLDVAVSETSDGLVVLPTWTPSWFGQTVEAHGVRTRWGTASYAIRWHGERPAILWEVEPVPGVDADGPGPTWSAPGLDPTWTSQGWTGEALLSRLDPPEGMVPTPFVSDHMQSGQRIDDAPVPSTNDEAPEAPKSFPGEGISFS